MNSRKELILCLKRKDKACLQMGQSCEGRGYMPKSDALQFPTLPYAVVTDKYPQHLILQESWSDESCHQSTMACKLYRQGLFPTHRLYHRRSRGSYNQEGWVRGISLGPEFCHMSWCWSQSLVTSEEEPAFTFHSSESLVPSTVWPWSWQL